jgi:hypothetical protein
VDPFGAIIYKTLCTLNRVLTRSTEVRDLLSKLWLCRMDDSRLHSPGPSNRLSQIAEDCNWR